MRTIFGISCLLLGAAMLLCQVEGAGPSSDVQAQTAVEWVRTAKGWERPDTWHLEVADRPTLHPLVVAAGQGLLAVFGLVLFHRDEH